VRCPGFFDLQVNGFGGVDFNGRGLAAGQVANALDRMRATGVTRCLPTLITSSFEDFAERARLISTLTHPTIAGIHMEGPYLSPEDGPRGAHPRAHVIPASIDDFKRRQGAASGRIRLVTLAPEVPGALALIEHLRRDGVQVAIGHTNAGPGTIADAVSAGAGLATHLGNGCAALLPRHPNVIWELLAADALLASLIVDGHHLPPSTVKSLVRAKSPARTVLITDAIAAAGAAPGRYPLGDVDVELAADGRVSLPGTPYLAGSSLTMDRAIGNTVRYAGLPIEQVLPMASTIPAAFIGVSPVGTVTADWDPVACRLTVKSINSDQCPIDPLTQCNDT
jgi:N-acetylglucosamine-6-phosphate deacetylase